MLHLRLGDGLCGQYDVGSADECKGAKLGTKNPRIPSCWANKKDCFRQYTYPKDYYEPVAGDLLELVNTTTRIVVVADPFHWTRNQDMRHGNYSINYAYMDNVVSFFRSKGFDVQIRQRSGGPDDDFVYMSSAQRFIPGGGGYAKLVSRVVTANGGRLFQPRKLSGRKK